MGSSNDQEDLPPSYQEVINSSSPPAVSSTQSTSYSQRPAAQPPRPGPRPGSRPRPAAPLSNSSYHTSQGHTPPGSSPLPLLLLLLLLPFTYPRGYWCKKCSNTGYKHKNGRTCKDCWETFAPRNSYSTVSSGFHPQYFGSTTFIPHPSSYSGGYQSSGPPVRVPPGDPRLGGVLCGRCRGSGMVRFLLDMELCPVCSGLGRVINLPRPAPAPAPPQQQQYYTPYMASSGKH